MSQALRESRSLYASLWIGIWLLLACSLMWPLEASGQEASDIPQPDRTKKLSLPKKVTPFKFTKVDLDLLHQVNEFDKYVEEKGWVFTDPATNQYLTTLGLSLVPKETPENVRWQFRAVRDLEGNAFALPNGSIYVTSGLLARMENEAQLAGVLAHEITHVVNRHSYRANRSSRKKMVAIDFMLAGASFTVYGALGSAVVYALVTTLPMIVVETTFGFSRELEHEADVYAVNALYLRGYDLREFSRGFELLRNGPEVDLAKESVFWSSYPKLTERAQYIREKAEQLQPNTAGLLVNQFPFRTATNSVVRNTGALALFLGWPRTALASANRLVAEEPNNAENYVLLGDAYRSLGARTPLPQGEELTKSAKNETRQRMSMMTLAEYNRALLAEPHGGERWQANFMRAEEAFRKALAIDPQNASAHRGLGLLYESNDAREEAIAELKKYLELAPKARDARQVKVHLQSLERPLDEKSKPDESRP